MQKNWRRNTWHNIDTIKSQHPNFFSPDTMRFFNSRILWEVYQGTEDGKVYFVTSERLENDRRFYHVRQLDQETGIIRNVGPWMELSRYDAIKLARNLSKSDQEKGA